MDQCRIETVAGPDHTTVRLVGDVDLACAERLAHAFGQALAADRPVVVDCAGITFIDSAGLRTFAEASALAGQCRLSFRLAAVHMPLSRVLELSGTTSLFDIVTDPD